MPADPSLKRKDRGRASRTVPTEHAERGRVPRPNGRERVHGDDSVTNGAAIGEMGALGA